MSELNKKVYIFSLIFDIILDGVSILTTLPPYFSRLPTTSAQVFKATTELITGKYQF